MTAVSEYLQKRTQAEFAIQREIRVIHNFVDTERYSQSANNCTKDHFAPNGEKILMHASNFRPRKEGHGCGSNLCHDSGSNSRSSCFWSVRVRSDCLYSNWLKSSNSSEDVLFLGEQEYIGQLMNCADLFFLPSEQESFGLVALEGSIPAACP